MCSRIFTDLLALTCYTAFHVGMCVLYIIGIYLCKVKLTWVYCVLFGVVDVTGARCGPGTV
jgi:hypothetical protein